jgi:hypothetical protein
MKHTGGKSLLSSFDAFFETNIKRNLNERITFGEYIFIGSSYITKELNL